MSHISFTYHLVFGTFRRLPVIDIAHERELYKFIYDFAMSREVKIWRIGGMPDHVHILCDIPAKIAVADFVKLLKTESSKFMRVNPHFTNWSRWAEGYGGFTIDAASRESRIRYIMNQKQHHKGVSFSDEYRELLIDANIRDVDEILGDR